MKLPNQTAMDDLLYVASKAIGTRTLFISHAADTFKVLTVFNQNGCNLAEGTELPKDHSI